MNFASGSRVVYNGENVGVEIPIGQKREVDIALPTLRFILKSMKAGDAGLVIVPANTELPETISSILGLLRTIESTPYDQMLSSIQALIGHAAIEPRPTRVQMRQALGKQITDFCERNMDMLIDHAQAPTTSSPRADVPDEALNITLGIARTPQSGEPIETPDSPGVMVEPEEDAPAPARRKAATSKPKAQTSKKAVTKAKKKARVRV